MALTAGTQLGRYEILAPLDAGGMGQVYRARDPKLHREVAIKVLHDDCADDPEWIARFEREARLLAALNHANIATIHGLEEAAGLHYLVMELVPGQTLAARLTCGAVPLDEALGYCRQLAEALEAAHERGIIHRDLKPGNVMITPDDKVKVLDFGLAKSTKPLANPAAPTVVYEGQTQPGVIFGTAGYMAPEQARGKSLDKRCDIWAFGCVLYETITGQRAFGGETYTDVLAAVLHHNPDFDGLPPSLPTRARDLLRRCLQKDPHKRLRDIGDARMEIEEILADLSRPPSASSQKAAKPPRPPRHRSFVPLALALLATLAVGALLGMWLQGRRISPQTGLAEPALLGWSGQILLGGTTRAFGPRVSPDGQWLAFGVLHEGQAQVGVMKLGSGEWWVLTRDRRRGGVLSVCWSPDSSLIYFDRFFDKPVGVFSVSPLDRAPRGARERLVVGDCDCPQAVQDGSLIVGKLDDAGNYRLHRHWGGERPDEEVSPPIEFDIGWPSPVRTIGENRVVFCGKVLAEDESPPKRRFYALDLETKKYRPLANMDVPISFVQIAVSPDGQFLCTVLPAGDLFRLVRIPIAQAGPPQTLVTLTTPAYGLDIDRTGVLYIDQFHRPQEVLRFDAGGGPVERLTTLARRPEGLAGLPIELPDGRVLLPSKVSGRDRLLTASTAGKDPVLLLESSRYETAPPAVVVGNRRLAFLGGSGKDQRLKIASLDDEELPIVRTLERVRGEGLTSLAASPDGTMLYYVNAKQVWKVPSDDSRAPQKIGPGDGVAVHPGTGDVIIQRFEKAGVRVYKGTPEGSLLKEIKVKPGNWRLVPQIFGGQAINTDGRILVGATAKDDWFWRVALLDPVSGNLERISVDYDGEIYPSNWGRNNKVLGAGYPLRSDLWRLTPEKEARQR